LHLVKLTLHDEWQRDVSDRGCAFAPADKEQSTSATTASFEPFIDIRSPICRRVRPLRFSWFPEPLAVRSSLPSDWRPVAFNALIWIKAVLFPADVMFFHEHAVAVYINPVRWISATVGRRRNRPLLNSR